MMTRGLQQRRSASADPVHDAGISALDLGNLPPAPRRILRLLLRTRELTYPALCAAVEALPAAERLSRAELDAVLKRLIEQGWLSWRDSAHGPIYTVNLRRPAHRRLNQPIWEALTQDR